MTSDAAGARMVDGRLAGAVFLEDPRVRRILALLNGDGEETRVVGGAPRDVLLGATTREVDFATTALPGVIAARAAAASLRVAPTGLDHGTLTLLVEGSPFEVTTLREDVATDGRRAKVRFGRSFEQDARRRDFTINALSVDAEGRLFDYVGGLQDLAARRLRFIGEPRARIREDFLRSLRFLRFHAQLETGPADAPALAAIIAEREGLDQLSRERVRAELLKLLVGRRAAETTGLMSEMGLFQRLLGGLGFPARLARLAAFEAAAGAAPDALLRLAAVAVLIAEDAERLRDRLRLANSERDRLAAAARALEPWHGRERPPAELAARACGYLAGARACADGLVLAFAESGAPASDESWRAAVRFARDRVEPPAPFSGADLIARGIPPGREVGRILKDLQARWIRAGFPRDAATIARLLDEAAGAGDAR